MARFKNRNGKRIPFTQAEEDARDAEEIKSAQERQARKAPKKRAKRTTLLRESDWTQLPDVPFGAPRVQAWRDYRQALRDIDFTDPDNIVWPTEPS